jgi:hypothetical protein
MRVEFFTASSRHHDRNGITRLAFGGSLRVVTMTFSMDDF